MRLLWLTLGFGLLGFPLIAFGQQQTIEHQFKGKPGANINLGIFASIHRDCRPAPLPVIRLIVPPAHGKVVVKQGFTRDEFETVENNKKAAEYSQQC